MEKSIETIWKEGFLKKDALVAPKLNNLYNQKSTHIVDKFKRMYEINRIAIIAFAIILLPMTFITNMPYMGIPMFFLFIGVVIVNTKFKKRLEKIDTGLDSYHYLSSFDQWMKEMVSLNTKLSRYLYPYIFISLILGFWFGSIGGDVPGVEIVNKIVTNYPDTYLLYGLPLIGILGFIVIVCLLAFFGGRIGKWDINLVYGGIIKKLDEILADMEELRA